jgi:hypothetical protein
MEMLFPPSKRLLPWWHEISIYRAFNTPLHLANSFEGWEAFPGSLPGSLLGSQGGMQLLSDRLVSSFGTNSEILRSKLLTPFAIFYVPPNPGLYPGRHKNKNQGYLV